MIVHLEPKIPPNCVLIGSQSLTLHTTCMERWGDCLLNSWGSIYVLRLESSVCTSLLNIQWSCNDEQWSKNVRVRDGDHNLNRNMYSVPSWLHIGLQASSCNSTPERRYVGSRPDFCYRATTSVLKQDTQAVCSPGQVPVQWSAVIHLGW